MPARSLGIGNELVAGLSVEEPDKTYAQVIEALGNLRKPEQREYVNRILDVIHNSDQWEVRATASHMLEAATTIDVTLVSVDIVDELAVNPEFSVRSSAAMIL